MPTIITENDISEWDDKTGEVYHFPGRYLKFLNPGTKVIYYKGRMIDKKFSNVRLANEPHYFGTAIIGSVKTAPHGKGYIAQILNYLPFTQPIIAKQNGMYLETIPESRKTNYWRDGVREISDGVYKRILSGYTTVLANNSIVDFETEFLEGKKKIRYGTVYERNPKLRIEALKIHGYDCKACKLNFEKKYGEIGKGFIHVHHIKPISEAGVRTVNPKTDLIPVCPNCHSIIHKPLNKILSIEELIIILKNAKVD